jgi:predicted nuclease with RNAse H fold
MKTIEKKFFIGIDLGGKEKKTTGVCILEKRNQKLIFEKKYCKKCKGVFGKDIIGVIRPYLKNTAVIAIDAPLTKGRGKGKMRLYEKFLSTPIFRKEKVNPIPPALMQKWCDFAREIRQKLGRRGFVLDLNLIEVFPTLTEKLCEENLFLSVFGKNLKKPCQNKDQESALICAILAYLHLNFKTRYLGYKDGFLFLPEMLLWKKDWRQKFYQAWMARPRLKYHHLITNVFVK